MDASLNGRCRARRADGSDCHMRALAGKLCQHHDSTPKAVARRSNTARTGGEASGLARRKRAEQVRALGPTSLRTSSDAIQLLERIANAVLASSIEPARARLLIQASNSVLMYARTQEIDSRLRQMEELVEEYHLADSSAWQGLFEGIREAREAARRRR